MHSCFLSILLSVWRHWLRDEGKGKQLKRLQLLLFQCTLTNFLPLLQTLQTISLNAMCKKPACAGTKKECHSAAGLPGRVMPCSRGTLSTQCSPHHATTFILGTIFFKKSTLGLQKPLLNQFWLQAEQFQLQMKLNWTWLLVSLWDYFALKSFPHVSFKKSNYCTKSERQLKAWRTPENFHWALNHGTGRRKHPSLGQGFTTESECSHSDGGDSSFSNPHLQHPLPLMYCS